MDSAEALEIAAAAASAAIDAIREETSKKQKQDDKQNNGIIVTPCDDGAKQKRCDNNADGQCDGGEETRPLSYTEVIALGYEEMRAEAQQADAKKAAHQEDKPKNRTWEERFADLVKFKGRHGHCDVPVSEKSGLGNWVRSQRSAYRHMEVGKASSLTSEREEKLTSVGFRWRMNRRAAKAVPWQERFDALVAFKVKYGHLDVDISTEGEHRDLKKWVLAQRHHYRKKKSGQKHSLPLEAEEKLRAIGFDFKEESFGSSQTAEKRTTWDERYADLVEYKKKSGNCNNITSSGTNNENHALYHWVSAQRGYWRKKQRGEIHSLSDRKEEMLRDIGFDFGTLEDGRKKRRKVAARNEEDDDAAAAPQGDTKVKLHVPGPEENTVDFNDFFG
jgi:hypothetical protein